MSSTMSEIKCPKCQQSLEQIVYASIEVDRCLNCKGIWFDSLEADKLKTIQGSESLDIGDPQTGTEFNQSEGDINCPRCSAKMIRMVEIDQHCIWYEKCPACQGIWLDAGEFKDFKNNFKPKGIIKRFRNIFNRGVKD